MTISPRGLLGADTAALRAVADRWRELVDEIDDTVEDLARGTRDLPHHWTGPAALAAQEENHDLQVRVGNAHRYCAADELEQYRRLLQGVLAEAEGQGMRVDLATGRVTGPPVPAADLPLAQAGVDAYAHQIDEILARANEADQRATEVLEANVLGDYELPGDDLPPYDETAVLASASYDPVTRARWWQAQHPLNRERAIDEFPQIVGAGEGLPAEDRDRANRLLLSRTGEELALRRQRLDDRHAGAGSRAIQDVDARLAEVAALEDRLAGAHLIGYVPGDEGNAELSR
jgi:uncharacterized protein YukE